MSEEIDVSDPKPERTPPNPNATEREDDSEDENMSQHETDESEDDEEMESDVDSSVGGDQEQSEAEAGGGVIIPALEHTLALPLKAEHQTVLYCQVLGRSSLNDDVHIMMIIRNAGFFGPGFSIRIYAGNPLVGPSWRSVVEMSVDEQCPYSIGINWVEASAAFNGDRTKVGVVAIIELHFFVGFFQSRSEHVNTFHELDLSDGGAKTWLLVNEAEFPLVNSIANTSQGWMLHDDQNLDFLADWDQPNPINFNKLTLDPFVALPEDIDMMETNQKTETADSKGEEEGEKEEEVKTESKEEEDDEEYSEYAENIQQLIESTKKHKKDLKIVSQNVRSLRQSFDEIRDFLLCEADLDMLVLQETWLPESDNALDLQIHGFVLFLNPRRSATVGGGTAAYVRTHLRPKICPEYTIQAEGAEYEQLCISVQVQKRKFYVLNCYRHSSVSSAEMCETLNENIDNLKMDHPQAKYIVCGDFNLDLIAGIDEHVSGLIEQHSLSQIVTKATRVTATSRTLIDWVLVPRNVNVEAKGVFATTFSDHCMVFVALDFRHRYPNRVYKLVRNYGKIDVEQFQNDLRECDWSETRSAIDAGDVNAAVTKFSTTFQKVFDAHAPEKLTRVKYGSLPWITDEIRGWQKLRDEHYAQVLRSRDPADWEEYKRIRNFTYSLIREAKSDYFTQEFENSYGNPRKFWNTIRKIFPKQKPDLSLGPEEDLKRANLFNQYFANIGAQTSDEVRNGHADPAVENIPQTENSFSFRPFTMLQLKHVVANLPKFKSPGFDGVNGYVASIAFPVIGNLLLDIFNLSTGSGRFPDFWKLSIVRPLHKSGSIDLPSNSRPVALLILFSKMLERLVFNQIRPYFEQFVSPAQYGFLSGKSTETALMKVCDEIYNAMERTKLSTVVLLDMSKAFDCVNHSILLEKMARYGMDNRTIEWFKSYLSNRTQRVKIGTQFSDIQNILAGVPQGSILGPLLFLMFVNDLLQMLMHSSLTMFADDIQLCITHRPQETNMAYRNLEMDLSRIYEWCCRNGLKNNSAKTQALCIGTARNLQNMPTDAKITFNGAELPFRTEAKNLGVIFDRNLNFKPHLNRVSQKCKNELFALRRAKSFLPRRVIIKTIESTIFPKLYYAAPIIHAAPYSYVEESIVRVVNLAAKTVFNLRKYDRATACRTELGWLDGHKELELRSLLLAYKAYVGHSPVDMVHPFALNNNRRSARLNAVPKLLIPNFRTNVGKRSFSYRAPSLLNEICETLQIDLENEAPNVSKFKSSVKNYYSRA